MTVAKSDVIAIQSEQDVVLARQAVRRLAQGLGFERCRSVCLQGRETVLSVSDSGPGTITGVTGPARQLANVLRSRGLK